MERLQLSKERQATPMELEVSKVFTNLETSIVDFKSLSGVKIVSVKEVQADKSHVIIISIPYKQIEQVKKISHALIPELEKNLKGAHVTIVGAHRAFPKVPAHGRRYKSIRPYGRTLRSVNEALLEDVVYPTSIVGKRIHYDLKGKQVTKVLLDKADKARADDRLRSFAAAYNRLTGIKAVFEVAQN